MNIASYFWKRSPFIFEVAQRVFNPGFWEEFTEKFSKYCRKEVIDLGCGTGMFLDFITPKVYLGIDDNPFYIKYARKKKRKNTISFFCQNIVSFRTGKKFETALLVSVAHHLTDKSLKKTLSNLKRERVKRVIVLDATPKGYYKKVFIYLESFLGGGKYFRNLKNILLLVEEQFGIKEKGIIEGKFYDYPYVVGEH